jgi:hypothetical protein
MSPNLKSVKKRKNQQSHVSGNTMMQIGFSTVFRGYANFPLRNRYRPIIEAAPEASIHVPNDSIFAAHGAA